MHVISAKIPRIDNCPILTRFKAFIADQGSVPTLEHTFRHRVTGNPVDLSEFVIDGTSESSSESPAGSVKLRVRTALGSGGSTNRDPIWEVEGSAYDAEGGIVHADLSEEITAQAGIYELSWAVVNANNQPVVLDRGLLSVERSLFTSDRLALIRNQGPPTLQELRMLMMDSSPNENLLLTDIEFKDEQLLLAITKPIQYWNEQPPPLQRQFTTRDFPFKGAWASATLAQLFLMAASHYRRNLLKHTAAGTAINDKDKEREYLAEGQRLWKEYDRWVQLKKVELNMRAVSGSVSSQYAGSTSLAGW